MPSIGLWAVADGMGGHNAGALASKCVVEKLSKVSHFESAYAYCRNVRSALLKANLSLQEETSRTAVETIGATAVVILVHGNHYACLWAGDSRAYVWRDGSLKQITQDHTLVAELEAAGKINPGSVASQRYAHVVTRAVGARPVLEIDCAYGVVQPGDRFLLCSDGLGVVDKRTVQENIASQSVGEAASALVREAILREATDNVTAVVVTAVASATPN
jgi:serine/threonine protein phosphatase PrpC